MPALNIVVLNKLSEHHISTILAVVPDANIIPAKLEDAHTLMPECDVLIAWGWMNIRPLLETAPRLKWVHALSAGVENIACPELENKQIILTNSKGIHGIPVSEHVLALMLAFTRGINYFVRFQQKKQWKRTTVDEIYDKTIGIVGLGSIGREIAKKAKALGMNVLAVKKQPTTELFVDELYSPERLNEMLGNCDFVVASVPLLPETKEMFQLEQFKAMKPSAYFINISRGAVVKEADLAAALEQEFIKGAGLDVFDQEPLAETSPLWDMANVIITPHIAALSPYYLDRAITLFAENLSRFTQNGEMINIIDKNKGY